MTKISDEMKNLPGQKNKDYLEHYDAFPVAVAGINTALPAFAGYTQKAELLDKDVSFKPVKINSFDEFEQVFGGGFKPVLKINNVKNDNPEKFDLHIQDKDLNNRYYFFQRAAQKNFYLYNSIRLFYENGGECCYVISTGTYKDVNSVMAEDLLKGVSIVREVAGITMVLVPDSILLNEIKDYQLILSAVLKQCGELRDRVAILDVFKSTAVNNHLTFEKIIEQFRDIIGEEHLNYAAAYFPFVETTLTSPDRFSYTNFALNDPATLRALKEILHIENRNKHKSGTLYDVLQDEIDRIAASNTAEEEEKRNKNLKDSLPVYKELLNVLCKKTSLSPPSGAIAGVYTETDSKRGVWTIPSNILLSSVNGVTYNPDKLELAKLNIPDSGKAINALRGIPGRGVVTWGAHTLGGMSKDYRYIQIRRTLIYIEQSIACSLKEFVSFPNNRITWIRVNSVISSFLQSIWSQGGLLGATASEAFRVSCGLGSTMTKMDIQNGYIIVNIGLQIAKAAEFFPMVIKQKMNS